MPNVEPFEPGIHIGLSLDSYLDDQSLGSTDLGRVLKSPPDFWWNSYMNAMRPSRKDTPDSIRGSANHAFVLEGQQAFDGSYMRRPDDDDDASPAEKSAMTKEWNKKARAAGKHLIKGGDYDRILISSKMITANPELAAAFTGGLPEVSIFFRYEEIPVKARFDYLKLRTISDLKAVKNPMGLDFEDHCLRLIAQRNYHIQAQHYLNARRAMREHAKAGRIFGKDYDPALFKRICESDEFAFSWVFYQADGAPLTWGKSVSPGNELLEDAQDRIEAALEKYRANLRQFGAEMWVLKQPFSELNIDEIRRVAPWFGMRA